MEKYEKPVMTVEMMDDEIQMARADNYQTVLVSGTTPTNNNNTYVVN